VSEPTKKWWINLTEKQVKILRLALDDAAHDGERLSASMAFVQSLRRHGSMPVQDEDKREASNTCSSRSESRDSAPQARTKTDNNPNPKHKLDSPTKGNCGALYCRYCSMRLWFGKWKTHQLHQVDSAYLRWMVENMDKPILRESAEHVLEARVD